VPGLSKVNLANYFHVFVVFFSVEGTVEFRRLASRARKITVDSEFYQMQKWARLWHIIVEFLLQFLFLYWPLINKEEYFVMGFEPEKRFLKQSW